MFPAYSSESKSNEKPNWLENKSFKTAQSPLSDEIRNDVAQAELSSSESSITLITSIGGTSSSEEKRKLKKDKKSKKKKKKKRKKQKKDEDEEPEYVVPLFRLKDVNIDLTNRLCDNEYKSYFSQISKETLKKCLFYEDFPNLTPRNSFKLNKSGDRNNLCFDSVHFKELPNYNVPYDPYEKFARASAKKKKLSRKDLRQQLLRQSREERYFVQASLKSQDEKTTSKQATVDLAQSTLSNRMWLYLEMKNEIDSQNSAEKNVNLTSDYMKYLDDNKGDVAKWLEFIEYNVNIKFLVTFSTVNSFMHRKNFDVAENIFFRRNNS